MQYYSRDIYLINFQYEIMAVKDGYLMDSVTISIREGKSILVYLPDRNYENLLHVQERTV